MVPELQSIKLAQWLVCLSLIRPVRDRIPEELVMSIELFNKIPNPDISKSMMV